MFSVHFDEIALKGKNRGKFIRQLIDSIKYSLEVSKIKFAENRILIEENTDKLDRLSLLPGVAWYAEALELSTFEDIESWLEKQNRKFNIDVRRLDKSKPFTSLEIKRKLYKYVGGEERIVIEIFSNKWILNYNIKKGIGGLPVGSAGKIIHLFSGGVDSSTAIIELMKRGAQVDLLHVYATTIDSTLESKIDKIASYISELERLKLYLAPSKYLYQALLKNPTNYELQIFKHFLLLLAQRLAETYNYLAISTGDSLSQVASQTLSSIYVVNVGINYPVLRPLTSRNKAEIIELAKKYKLYELANEKYKDFCSLVSKHPITNPKLNNFLQEEEKLKLSDVLEKTLNEIKIFNYEKRKRI
jgi:thiamine biosynthesis protein ThiI